MILYTLILFFLVSNDKAISETQETHDEKLQNFFFISYSDNSVT